MRVLGFLFFMLFLAAFAFVILKGRQPGADGDAVTPQSIAGTRWRVQSILDEPVADTVTLTVEFDGEGSIFGDGGCNLYSGSLEGGASGITVTGLRSTRKACAEEVMQREAALFAALGDTASVRGGDDALTFLSEDGAVALQLEPLPAAR